MRSTPGWWHEGEEPDYRFSLANERTFLAWIRTALALIGGAIAVSTVADDVGPAGAVAAIASASVVVGAVLAAGAYRRWAQVQRAMRLRQPLPHPPLLRLLAVATTVAGFSCLVLVVGA